jgi:hypothetical protein
MKRFGSAGLVVGMVSAGLIGFSGTAQAYDDPESSLRDRGAGVYRGDSNNPWRHWIVPRVKVPKVDTSVRTSP